MKYKVLAALVPLVSAICFAGSPVLAEANTVPPYWEGADASGAIVKGDDCPVIVENQTIHLHITSLPRDGKVDSSSYTSEAVTEYTFFNPTQEDVDMSLLLPFGVFPSYMSESAEDKVSAVTVDGEPAECAVRYSFSSGAFQAEKDISRVLDEKKADAFYREDLPVYEYRIVLSPYDTTEDGYLKIKLCFNPKKTRVLFPLEGTRLCIVGGDFYAYTPLRNTRNQSAVFFAAGEALTEVVPQLNDDNENSVAVSAPLIRSMTFSEFALSKWSEESGVSETDWYNAVVDMLNEKSGYSGSVDSFTLTFPRLMRWYEYEMKIPAESRVVSQVKAPLYPTVEGSKNPRYEYSYLLSPAAKWADFKNIEIRIDTPYFLSNGSLDFVKLDKEGEYFTYSFKRASLPQGELTFVLTETDESNGEFNVYDDSFLRPSFTWAFVTLSVLAGVAAVVTVIAVVSLKKRNK